MEKDLRSLPTELWYPYGGPGRTHGSQTYEGIEVYLADNENYCADSTDYPRSDRVTPGS